MKWRDSRRSQNVEDGRGDRTAQAGMGLNLGTLIPIVRFLLGSKIGRIVLVVGVAAYFIAGINPLALLEGGMGGTQTQVKDAKLDDERAEFVSAILAQTEDVWSEIFKSSGLSYKEPKLRLFRGAVSSACGVASSQTGPFYCPADEKVYIDLSFFDDLADRYGAAGDFAQAYVISHEVGHHVQNLLGTLSKSHQLKQRLSQSEQNAIQVKVELQADCYGGVWAHYMGKFNRLDDGDIDEALRAANQIGDDTLQKQSQGYVVPDSFTHGSAAQRQEWFKRGFESGNASKCDTGI